jgi:nitrile hydratase accessory protein
LRAPDAAAILPREPAPGAPVFAEPWHAEVLAIAYALTHSGLFTAGEWAEALGAEIRRSGEAVEPDSDASYYRSALTALERLVGVGSPETGASLDERVEAWRRAYLNTAHGRPVILAAGADLAENRHVHDHDHEHPHDR